MLFRSPQTPNPKPQTPNPIQFYLVYTFKHWQCYLQTMQHAGGEYGTQGYHGHGHEEVNDIEFICDDGKPLQIVKYDKSTGKFTLEPEAVNVCLYMTRSCLKSKVMWDFARWLANTGLERVSCSTSCCA